jgi:hypothetical protein
MEGVTLDEGMDALEALSKTKDKQLTLTPPARERCHTLFPLRHPSVNNTL